MKLLESHIERAIGDYLALDAWYVRHYELNWSERKQLAVGERGMADLLCIRYHPLAGWANLLWIEVKRPGGVQSRWQREWKDREQNRGALVITAGVDFEASIEGFIEWYEQSKLQVRYVRLGGRKKLA